MHFFYLHCMEEILNLMFSTAMRKHNSDICHIFTILYLKRMDIFQNYATFPSSWKREYPAITQGKKMLLKCPYIICESGRFLFTDAILQSTVYPACSAVLITREIEETTRKSVGQMLRKLESGTPRNGTRNGDFY